MLTLAITVGEPAAAAESDEWVEPSPPHNYSLPRDAFAPRQDISGEAAAVSTPRDAASLPDLGGAAVGKAEQRGHMPYGRGYEARRRNGAFDGGMGGGRGMGRRR